MFGWSIALSLAIVTTVWHDFLFKQLEVTRFQIIFTASLLRTIMAVIGAWFIYSTWLGIPGITSFFSKHIFIVLGRINFSTFMIHMLLIWHNDFKLHHPIEYRTFPLVSRWITELVCSHVLGYAMYLIIEAPFNNLTTPFLRRALIKLSHRSNERKCLQTNGHQQCDKVKANWSTLFLFKYHCVFHLCLSNYLFFTWCGNGGSVSPSFLHFLFSTTWMIHLLNRLPNSCEVLIVFFFTLTPLKCNYLFH